MRVLMLRPEGSEIPKVESMEIINVEVMSPFCIDYGEPEFDKYDALAFTSRNAVRCFRHVDHLKHKRVFAVGPSTAEALKGFGVKVDYPKEFTTRKLAELIMNKKIKSVLAFRSRRATDSMEKVLCSRLSYREVRNYDVQINPMELERARRIISECGVDVIALTSYQIALLVRDYLKECIKVVSIGPETSRALTSARFIEAKTHTIEGIISTIRAIR